MSDRYHMELTETERTVILALRRGVTEDEKLLRLIVDQRFTTKSNPEQRTIIEFPKR